ncbi:serine hydrolase domain-containing protein [Erythrobacter sp. Alg231-14]|uniref:serine hydrolase domain-containing protein n=1 Tax=Erythrobacter sp. Alg231-14 TaxID=1922225 RepID=UPI00307C3B10
MNDFQSTLDTALSKTNVIGAVAAIGNSGGITSLAAAGLSDAASGNAMATDSIFQIASMTKAITSAAALQLVERGALSMDDPIGAVLPDLGDAQVLIGFADDGSAQTRAANSQITLRHLLTHTSGLGYSFTSGDMGKAQGEVVPGSLNSLKSPLMFEPGSDWLYGVNTDWVGLAVEAVSGQSLGDYMAQQFFEPMGMKDTGFAVPTDKASRRVSLMAATADGFAPFPLEIGGGDAAEFTSGGGGLYSTAPDYMRFMQMILGKGVFDGNRILSEESVRSMSTNQIGGIRAGKMESFVPMLANTFDAFPDMQSEWGLGFLINPKDGRNGRAAGSLAWAGIANCYYWIDPANDIAGLALMQFLPFGDERALGVFAQVEQSAYRTS